MFHVGAKLPLTKLLWLLDYLKFAVSAGLSPGSTVRVCSVIPSLQPAQVPFAEASAVIVTGVPAKNGIVSVGESSGSP